MKNKIIIYTDGASSGNPGPGGWGAVVRINEKVKELGGHETETTNNRMEMTAALEALRSVKFDKICDSNELENSNNTTSQTEIKLFTDSSYLINGITKWIFNWKRNNWKTKSGDEVLNKDLWQKLDEQISQKKVAWIHVAGHAGIKLNNRVDEIAVAFSKAQENKQNHPELFNGLLEKYEFDVEEPTEEELSIPKTKSSSKNSSKNKKAFSYLSMIDGIIEKHQTWDECKARVEGQSNAKYRKALSDKHEEEIIKEWETI